jgi:hypothetical protein
MREVVAALAPLTGATLPPEISVPVASPVTSQRFATAPTTLGSATGVQEPREVRPTRRLGPVAAAAGVALAIATAVTFVLVSGDRAELEAAAAPPLAADAAVRAASVPPGEIDAGAALAEDPADAAPTEAQDVVIRLDSSPSAAAVFSADSGERLGTTPFEYEVERSEDELRFVLKRRGHHDREVTLSREDDTELRVELERIRTPARQPARQPSRPPSRETDRDWGDILD